MTHVVARSCTLVLRSHWSSTTVVSAARYAERRAVCTVSSFLHVRVEGSDSAVWGRREGARALS